MCRFCRAEVDPEPPTKVEILHWSMQVNYEAWNQYVLMGIGLFAVLLYVGLLYAGFAEFMSRVSKRSKNKKRPRSRVPARRLRNPKVPGS